MRQVWRLEDNMEKSVLTFRSGTQVIRPSDKCLYPLSHLVGLGTNLLADSVVKI